MSSAFAGKCESTVADRTHGIMPLSLIGKKLPQAYWILSEIISSSILDKPLVN